MLSDFNDISTNRPSKRGGAENERTYRSYAVVDGETNILACHRLRAFFFSTLVKGAIGK